MGREVRRVPANWVHPSTGFYANGKVRFTPLYEGDWYRQALQEFEAGDRGEAPDVADYMPQWPEGERTHFMMYEDTSEGTPISPAFATPEELARWLADTGASAFADQGASYEGWLRIAQGGSAPSCIISAGTGLLSGVEFCKGDPK